MKSIIKRSKMISIDLATTSRLNGEKYMREDTLEEIDMERAKYLLSPDDLLEEMVS